MYQIYCDKYMLYDPRDEDLVVSEPKCKLEVNTIGEASFSIYSNHPYYNTLEKLRSIIEIKQDGTPIFRGRITTDTVDFNNMKLVDVEGAMGYFNDSIVRPFKFPKDFDGDPLYLESPNKIEFFLNWLIENHNAQVQNFQQFKLGIVTVTDPNNYIERSSIDHMNTWEVLRENLFESTHNGYLCIRYEADGNYIDYLADFTEVNSQKIVFGENLLDLTTESTATELYTAIIPLGKKIVNIEDMPNTDDEEERLGIKDMGGDGELTADIVKAWDTLYSKSGVEKYGWIYAPPKDTLWEDVEKAEILLEKGFEYLEKKALKLANTITVKAIDLHLSDEEIEALRIYKYVEIESKPHGLETQYRLSSLELDLENPQNTVITLGDISLTMSDINTGIKHEINTSNEALKHDFSSKMQSQETIILQKSEELVVAKVEQLVDSITFEVLKNLENKASISLLGSLYCNYIYPKDSDMYLGSSDYNTFLNGATVYLKDTNTVLTSDKRAKNSVEELPPAYECFFDNLKPIRFKYNSGKSGRYHLGYIAQDVKQALEDSGLSTSDFAGYVDMGEDLGLGLAYDEFIALLHMALIRQKGQIDKLEGRIAELERNLQNDFK